MKYDRVPAHRSGFHAEVHDVIGEPARDGDGFARNDMKGAITAGQWIGVAVMCSNIISPYPCRRA